MALRSVNHYSAVIAGNKVSFSHWISTNHVVRTGISNLNSMYGCSAGKHSRKRGADIVSNYRVCIWFCKKDAATYQVPACIGCTANSVQALSMNIKYRTARVGAIGFHTNITTGNSIIISVCWITRFVQKVNSAIYEAKAF